ncbi:GIY-YIG nuclease family protein [Candidatus Bathyarchaeota archaeon]|nr:GIY-YIG nuclease family protein [Candidatus Bathyarchaeota archaeon]
MIVVPYYVYILRCEDDSYYTGFSKNLPLRMKLHWEGKGAKYTRMHKPKKLVYIERFDSRSHAMNREKQVKKLNHHQKDLLITSQIKLKI